MTTRREFLTRGALASAALAAGAGGAWAEEPGPLGKAENCIFIWLGGGVSQIDTFDPKPIRGDLRKQPGGYYGSIDTAIPGVQVSEHLPGIAKLFDHFVPLRTVHHNIVDEHAAATNHLHTGRPVSGSVVYPSIGSIIAHQRKAALEGVPPYVLLGYPSATRGPGFLGPKAGYVYLTDLQAGPAGLLRAPEIPPERQARRESLLAGLRASYLERHPGEKMVRDYDDAIAAGFALQNGDFMKAFDLPAERAALRAEYGEEFGQRCLLARRLLQRGVRFVEVGFSLGFVNGVGWDIHQGAYQEQFKLIQVLDRAVAALIRDLERERMLEKTLVVIATEFGRPATFDAGGGRGHYGKCFTCLLAGGGLRTGQVIGQTDALAMNIEAAPVTVPDFFATVVAALGIKPGKHLFDGERPVPVTDRGTAIAGLFV